MNSPTIILIRAIILSKLMSANRYQTCQQHEKHNKNVLGEETHEKALAKTENYTNNKN